MPRVVPVQVDTHLRVDGNLLGHDLVDNILDEVTLVSHEREDGKRLNRYGWWDLPENILMADLDGDTLVLPRGYALQLKLLLRERGLKVWWQDRTVWHRGAPVFGKDEFSYLAHQPAAVRKIIKHRQGIYKAPTGSGKTVSALGVIWELHPRRSIVLVDRINLVDQWKSRIVEHTGLRPDQIGVIGDGEWSEGVITIATVQTLHRHIKRLRREGWFDLWDLVCLDECHHVTAETLLELIQCFPARYRFGMSATPDKTGLFEIALNALGEVFYETTHEELRRLGLLVEPEVTVVPTEFTFVYWRDHKADKKGNCEKPDCKLRKPFHGHRNNYAQLKDALVTDAERNIMILDQIARGYQTGAVQLVITDQTKHIDYLMEEWNATHGQFVPEDHVHVLTGKQKRKKREAIIAEIETVDEPHVIFSTIAGEALDIPIIAHVHLIYPTRNPRKTEQNIGRATRMHDRKGDSLIYDYVDVNVPILVGQFRSRRWKCYEPLGFTVNAPDETEDQPPKGRLLSLGKG